MEKKLVAKSGSVNEILRGDKRGMQEQKVSEEVDRQEEERRGDDRKNLESKESRRDQDVGDVNDKKRIKSPPNEEDEDGEGRGGGLGWAGGKRLRRQDSHVDRSLRVLEWLDADCGTRLAQHYEKDGGWRYHDITPPPSPPTAPRKQRYTAQRRRELQRLQAVQRQRPELRATKSNTIVIDTAAYQDATRKTFARYALDDTYIYLSSDDTSEGNRKLDHSDDSSLDLEEDADDDDLVLALRKWQEEQQRQQEYLETLSMQDYITSSEEDSDDDDDDDDDDDNDNDDKNDNDSYVEGEDELVLALKAWKEEQERLQYLQEKHLIQQQKQKQFFQSSLPNALTPVIEERPSPIASPEFTGAVYQGPSLPPSPFQRGSITRISQKRQSIVPYWWGDIGSVREGPSSPPVVVRRTAQLAKPLPGSGNSSGIASGQGSSSSSSEPGSSPARRFLYSGATSPGASLHQGSSLSNPPAVSPFPNANTTTTVTSSPSGPTSTLALQPPSPFLTFPSPKIDHSPNWALHSPGADKSGTDAKSDSGSFLDVNTVGQTRATTPTSPRKPNPVGTGAFSAFLIPSSPSPYRHDVAPPPSPIGFSLAKSNDKLNATSPKPPEFDFTRESNERLLRAINSSGLADSGADIPPPAPSPAPAQKSAGIEKISEFFRKFGNKLSPSVGSSASSSPKTPPSTPTTPLRKLQQQQLIQQQLRLRPDPQPSQRSSSTSCLPNSPLKTGAPLSPLSNFFASQTHSVCSATRSDPSATRTVPKRQYNSWWGGGAAGGGWSGQNSAASSPGPRFGRQGSSDSDSKAPINLNPISALPLPNKQHGMSGGERDTTATNLTSAKHSGVIDHSPNSGNPLASDGVGNVVSGGGLADIPFCIPSCDRKLGVSSLSCSSDVSSPRLPVPQVQRAASSEAPTRKKADSSSAGLPRHGSLDIPTSVTAGHAASVTANTSATADGGGGVLGGRSHPKSLFSSSSDRGEQASGSANHRLISKRAAFGVGAGESNQTISGSGVSESSRIVSLDGLSGTQQSTSGGQRLRDYTEGLRKSFDTLERVFGDANSEDNTTGIGTRTFNAGTPSPRIEQSALRKSPVPDVDKNNSSEQRDFSAASKIRTFFARSGGDSSSYPSSEDKDGGVGNTSVFSDSPGVQTVVYNRRMIESRGRGGKSKEDSISSERSSSTSSEEKGGGGLTVPPSGQEGGRRGSHGTCNHLFLEQATGRKSPLPPTKGRKSPSPVRSLFKSVTNSTSTSSSSSSAAEPSSKQQKGGAKVKPSSSPSSPPPCLYDKPMQGVVNKTSPKHTPQHSLSESPTKKIFEGPPPFYRGRRKFSDTGLTPVPKRLFSETQGRRGSLTDERTLVFAKSKLGRLRHQGRKSSDAGSVATLVKQIHNLWGEGDEDVDEGDASGEGGGGNGRRESSGLTCSVDDQVLFDKRRKKFPFSISRDKDAGGNNSGGGTGGGSERKLLNKISCTGQGDNSSLSDAHLSDCGAPESSSTARGGKNKDNSSLTVGHFTSHSSSFLQSSSSSSTHTGHSITTGEAGCQTPDTIYHHAPSEPPDYEVGGSGGDTSYSGGFSCLPSSGGADTVGTGGGSEVVAPLAQVASRQLVAAAVSGAASLVCPDSASESLITGSRLGGAGATAPVHATCAHHNVSAVSSHQGTQTTDAQHSGSNILSPGSSRSTNKRGATVQFEPIASWDDNSVEAKCSPALRSVLKQGAGRRHSSFAGFTDTSEDYTSVVEPVHTGSLTSVLKKTVKNGLPKSKTSDLYKSILKQSDRPELQHHDSTASAPPCDKKRSKSPSPKSKKGEKIFDESSDTKSSELSLSLCLKASRSLSPKSKKLRAENRDRQDSLELSYQAYSDKELSDSGNCSLDLPTKTVGVQATPRTIGKTSNTGTQTSDLPLQGGPVDSADFFASGQGGEGSGWLQRLAAKCMASVGGSSRHGSTSGGTVPSGGSGGSSGSSGGGGPGLPRAASVRAEWLLGNKRMGSNPSSPVAPGADASEKFWVPQGVIARKRAQSLVPTLSKQESEEDLSSEAATPASIPHPRDLAFTFPAEKPGTSGSSDGQPSTPPPSGYNPGRRRASMHDAIDLTKIDARLYDKKLVRQASVTSIEEESQGTVHISLEHNPETNILTVNLVRAHNLLPRDIHGTSNPYCRLTLLPDQRTSAQSRIHRKTVNPEFEEEFIFECPTEEVDSSTLEISFYEYDQFSKDECVGFVRIPLEGLDLSKQLDLWRSISPYEKPKDHRDLGDVMFSLSYLPSAERLTVVMVKARNLRVQDDNKQDLNPFIKVSITSGNKKIKKKKTSTAHGTNSPTWNEALVFSVHRENLRQIALEVTAYHDNKIGIDECIGRIKLPADSENGVRCQDLLKEKGTPARWYSLA